MTELSLLLLLLLMLPPLLVPLEWVEEYRRLVTPEVLADYLMKLVLSPKPVRMVRDFHGESIAFDALVVRTGLGGETMGHGRPGPPTRSPPNPRRRTAAAAWQCYSGP